MKRERERESGMKWDREWDIFERGDIRKEHAIGKRQVLIVLVYNTSIH